MAMYHDPPKPPAVPPPTAPVDVPPSTHRWALVLVGGVVPVLIASVPGGLFDSLELWWAAAIGQLLGLSGVIRAVWLLASHVPTGLGGLPLLLSGIVGGLAGGGVAMVVFWEGLLDDLFGYRGLGLPGWGLGANGVLGVDGDVFQALVLIFATMFWLAGATWWANR